MQLAIFDCDGTLVDSQATICRAMEDACVMLSLEAPERSAIRRIVGLSVPVAVARLFPNADNKTQASMSEAYKQAYRAIRQAGEAQEPLYDGMQPLIQRLHAEGWLLGVATGKSKRGLDIVIDMHQLQDYFITLQAADFHPSKPHPAMIEAAVAEAGCDMDQAVMIGDTTYDITMAAAAGCRSIGVTWGYHDANELIAAGAGYMAQTMTDLYDALQHCKAR